MCFSIYSKCCLLASFLLTVCYRSGVITLLSGLAARECPQLKMVYSDYVRQRILSYHRLAKSFVQITHCLAKKSML